MDYKDTDATAAVCGTIGHMAHEYISNGKVSEKTDVFGYGIMLLELITGQRVFDLERLVKSGDVRLRLLDWVKGLLIEKKLGMLVDPDLKKNYVEEEVEQLIQVALLCCQNSPMDRPKMSEVVKILENDDLSKKWDAWQNMEEVRKEVEVSTLADLIITDSTEDLDAIELTGSR